MPGLEWSCRLLVDLPTLVLLAVSAHGCHVLSHTFPHKTCSHNVFGGTYARVSHVVDGVEDSSSVCLWYQWPGDATCHVAQQAGPLYLDSPHCQGGLSSLQRAWTAGLIGRQPGERDA
jgi:hypothetical protein